ncbi:MAG: adenylate/guanylate cyclase domain-containing protein [Acidimicrobiia bacterium]
MTVNRQLTRFLRRRGAVREEIEAAASDGSLTVFALDRLLVPGRPHLTADQIAAASGVSTETAALLWRALGFPDVAEDDERFTDEAVEVLRLLTERSGSSIFLDGDDAALVAQVRAVATGLARVAESMSDQIVEGVAAAQQSGLDDELIATTLVETLDWNVLARLTDYALRVQVRDAVRRKLMTPHLSSGEIPNLAVGFLDLVGYTALSQELDAHELNALVTRFEALTYDTVAQLGARLVKTIGDEVMFVAEDPAAVLQVALALTDRTRHDELLPRARAGLAFGPALAREGDYYGTVVNLAHRLVEIARPMSVIVAADLVTAVGDRPEFSFARLRSRRIRDIGRVEIYAVSARPPAELPDAAAG